MNTKNLWIASLSGAAVSLLATNLPYVSFINCLLCAGFWGSAIFAVWLYRRLSGTLTVGDGVRIGALSGLLAGMIGFLLSFVGLAGVQVLTNSLRQSLPPDAIGDMQEIPAAVAIGMNLMGVVIEVIFGIVGGWIGGVIFRTDRVSSKIGE
jgi:hypothetical protein